MELIRATLDTCSSAIGTVVVIDVLRAFSTAAYAFTAGVETITLVSTVEEALEMKAKNPQLILMGEMDGLPIPGFDFGNSPPQFDGLDFAGRHMVQRTTSGTQGVIRSRKADRLLAASFCNVNATVRYIKNHSPDKAAFVITGSRSGGWGDEDAACADYFEELLKGRDPAPEPFLKRVRESPSGQLFTNSELPDYLIEDLEYCLAIDSVKFAMPISRQGERLIMIAQIS